MALPFDLYVIPAKYQPLAPHTPASTSATTTPAHFPRRRQRAEGVIGVTRTQDRVTLLSARRDCSRTWHRHLRVSAWRGASE